MQIVVKIKIAIKMGTKCTPDPTITVIRDLKATTTTRRMRMRTRSLVGLWCGIAAMTTILLCQLDGSYGFSVGGGGGGDGSSDTPFVVQGPMKDRDRYETDRDRDRDANDVMINEVEAVQKTCDR